LPGLSFYSRDFLAILLLGAAFHKRCSGDPTLGCFGRASNVTRQLKLLLALQRPGVVAVALPRFLHGFL